MNKLKGRKVNVSVEAVYFTEDSIRKTLVDIHIEGGRLCVSPEDAKEHALAILEAANHAEHHRWMVRWLMEQVGMNLNQAVTALSEFKKVADEEIERRTGAQKGPVEREVESARSDASLIPHGVTCPVCRRGGSEPVQSD